MFYIFIQIVSDITSKWICYDSKETAEEAHEAAQHMKEKNPNWEILVMELMGRY